MSSLPSSMPKRKRKSTDLVASMRRIADRAPARIRVQATSLAGILETMRDCETRRRRALARSASPLFPESMVAEVNAAVCLEDDAIPRLYEIFRTWVEAETEAIRLKHMACIYCDPPRRGNFSVPGVGWVCRDHYGSMETYREASSPVRSLVNPMEVVYGIRKQP